MNLDMQENKKLADINLVLSMKFSVQNRHATRRFSSSQNVASLVSMTASAYQCLPEYKAAFTLIYILMIYILIYILIYTFNI